MSTHYKKIIWFIVAISFIASISYALYFRIQPIVDARAYDNIALEVLDGKGYPLNANNRPGPGYPLFLVLIYAVFGHYYPIVWIIQSLLLAGSAFLIFLITKEIFLDKWHPIIGLSAAALIGFSPDLITIASMLMTETLLIFSLIGAILYIFKYTNTHKSLFLLWGALFLSIAALTRGNMVVIVIPILLFLFWKHGWKPAAIFFVALVLFLTPWTIKNYFAYHQFMPFNASPGILYVGNHPGATGELVPDYPLPSGVTLDMSQIDFDNALGEAGVEYVVSHPLEFTKLTFWRTSIYFSFVRPFAFWPHLDGFSRLATIVLSSAYSLLVFILGFLGTVASLRKRVDEKIKSNLWLLFWIMLAMPLAIVALVVETRYRFPIYPLLAVFGGYGIWLIASNWRQTVKPLVITAAILGANTVFDIIRNWQRILDKINHI
ncbi:MAG: glycosyltransferase family 39 protein [bacterium]|nr:glycosyltransferase family 39 protein [bacterium]